MCQAAYSTEKITAAMFELTITLFWMILSHLTIDANILSGFILVVKPIVFATVGYSDDEPRPKVRKSIDELVRYEHW